MFAVKFSVPIKNYLGILCAVNRHFLKTIQFAVQKFPGSFCSCKNFF